MKNIFLTGATSGFGEAIAYRLAKHDNINMVITGRSEDKLMQVAKTIESTSKTKVLPLVFDVRDYAQCEKAVASLPAEFKPIDTLINNAGLALGLDPLHQGSLADWEQMLDTNVKGLLYITRLIAPQMVEQKKGHIVNLGSTASHEVYAGGNVYCASKHAVLALSKAMRTDFLPHNIKVTQVSPGAAETNFSNVRFHGDTERADKVYQGYTPLYADDIANIVEYALTLPEHVCLNEIIVTPTAQFNGAFNKK